MLTETDIVISTDSRQMGDWLAGGKYAFSMFGPVSRMDLDMMQTQGLPVDWFDPDQLKEGAYITAGSGGVALMSKAPHPNAAKVAINWLLSREGQIDYQRLFTHGKEGPDSLRIDIPKDKVPRGNRRPGWRRKSLSFRRSGRVDGYGTDPKVRQGSVGTEEG